MRSCFGVRPPRAARGPRAQSALRSALGGALAVLELPAVGDGGLLPAAGPAPPGALSLPQDSPTEIRGASRNVSAVPASGADSGPSGPPTSATPNACAPGLRGGAAPLLPSRGAVSVPQPDPFFFSLFYQQLGATFQQYFERLRENFSSEAWGPAVRNLLACFPEPLPGFELREDGGTLRAAAYAAGRPPGGEAEDGEQGAEGAIRGSAAAADAAAAVAAGELFLFALFHHGAPDVGSASSAPGAAAAASLRDFWGRAAAPLLQWQRIDADAVARVGLMWEAAAARLESGGGPATARPGTAAAGPGTAFAGPETAAAGSEKVALAVPFPTSAGLSSGMPGGSEPNSANEGATEAVSGLGIKESEPALLGSRPSSLRQIPALAGPSPALAGQTPALTGPGPVSRGPGPMAMDTERLMALLQRGPGGGLVCYLSLLAAAGAEIPSPAGSPPPPPIEARRPLSAPPRFIRCRRFDAVIAARLCTAALGRLAGVRVILRDALTPDGVFLVAFDFAPETLPATVNVVESVLEEPLRCMHEDRWHAAPADFLGADYLDARLGAAEWRNVPPHLWPGIKLAWRAAALLVTDLHLKGLATPPTPVRPQPVAGVETSVATPAQPAAAPAQPVAAPAQPVPQSVARVAQPTEPTQPTQPTQPTPPTHPRQAMPSLAQPVAQTVPSVASPVMSAALAQAPPAWPSRPPHQSTLHYRPTSQLPTSRSLPTQQPAGREAPGAAAQFRTVSSCAATPPAPPATVYWRPALAAPVLRPTSPRSGGALPPPLPPQFSARIPSSNVAPRTEWLNRWRAQPAQTRPGLAAASPQASTSSSPADDPAAKRLRLSSGEAGGPGNAPPPAAALPSTVHWLPPVPAAPPPYSRVAPRRLAAPPGAALASAAAAVAAARATAARPQQQLRPAPR